MNHLKTYEGFEIGDFKTFIDKYKKKGYISRTDMKRMDATDMKFEYFDRISKKVDSSYNFFEINDFETLSYLMLDVYDEFPSIHSDDVRYSFGISYEDKINYYGGGGGVKYIDVSVDDKGKPVFKFGTNTHAGLMDKKDVIQSIIDGVVKDREYSIKAKESEIKDPQRTHRAGVEPYGLETLRNLKTRNPFRNLNIKAYIYIDVKITESDFDWRSQSNDRYHMVENFKKLTIEQLVRYFSMLGNIYRFEIGCSDYSNSYPRFTVAINI